MNRELKRVIVSVTNDLSTDQRVDRLCRALVKMGLDVLLVGRELSDSVALQGRPYKTRRFRLRFVRGPLFYAEYNLRLFVFLLSRKALLFVSNDLDTLLASFIASRIRRIPLVHDCHEYFRGVPELNGRQGTVRIWKLIEDFIFPRLKTVYAVNESIARIYQEEYGNHIRVIRNVPAARTVTGSKKKSDICLDQKEKIIVYQGAINVDRGLEEAVLAMRYISVPARLVLIGKGDILDMLKSFTREQKLDNKVTFLGRIPLEELHEYTVLADVGLSIEKDTCLNYHYCLPNKFLDYIHAWVPVLISPLPEMQSIVNHYNIGEEIPDHDPLNIAAKLDAMLGNPELLNYYRENCKVAARDISWEKEEEELNRIYGKFIP